MGKSPRQILIASLCFGLLSIASDAQVKSHVAPGGEEAGPRSAQYEEVQRRLARGWNTWDVHSVATQVLLPEGLAIHVGMKHNSSLNGDAWLGDALIGSLEPGAPVVTPGPHAWDGSYTRADYAWKGHKWRVETKASQHDVDILVTPLENSRRSALPATVAVLVDYLWGRKGTVSRSGDVIEARSESGLVSIHCSCTQQAQQSANQIGLPIGGAYFAADLTGPVEISTRKTDEFAAQRMLRQRFDRGVLAEHPELIPVADAIETTLGWDTIYDLRGNE